MPTVAENQRIWTGFDWSMAGEEWSVGFGGGERAWFAVWKPRIRHCLPAARVVELGPGFGAWTGRLVAEGSHVVALDITERCVEACRQRFPPAAVTPRLTDGRSMPGVADRSIDLVFSAQSLVHADWDCMAGYLAECARVLKPGASAFMHHSNMAACAPDPQRDAYQIAQSLRGPDVSAERMREEARRLGLECVVQEIVPWGGHLMNDCFTLVRQPASGARGGAAKHPRHREPQLLDRHPAPRVGRDALRRGGRARASGVAGPDP